MSFEQCKDNNPSRHISIQFYVSDGLCDVAKSLRVIVMVLIVGEVGSITRVSNREV
jgi:hypothetical protein